MVRTQSTDLFCKSRFLFLTPLAIGFFLGTTLFLCFLFGRLLRAFILDNKIAIFIVLAPGSSLDGTGATDRA